MKVLFVGAGWLGSNARSLADGFRLAGHDVVLIDTTAVSRPERLSYDWVYSKVRSRRNPESIERVHRQIEAAVAAWRPDVLFCFKTIHLDQQRLLTNRGTAVAVHYSPDDVGNPENTTPKYFASERDWDLVVSTKRHNIPELKARGARDTLFVMSAYDPAWHRPVARRGTDVFNLGFIGVARPDRADLISALARRYGRQMTVQGPGWRRGSLGSAHVGPAAYGEDLSIAISGIRCNLVLLNSANRDTHTCRSFEVPAAGGLFVGERTREHEALIDHGVEGYLFDSADELVQIVDRMEASPHLATQIAERGYRAIVGAGNAYSDRAREIVGHLA